MGSFTRSERAFAFPKAPTKLFVFFKSAIANANSAKVSTISRHPACSTSPSKAPEGWRSPRRFAWFGCHRSTRQRLGLRRPSAAFLRSHQNIRVFQISHRKFRYGQGEVVLRRLTYSARPSKGPGGWRSPRRGGSAANCAARSQTAS